MNIARIPAVNEAKTLDQLQGIFRRLPDASLEVLRDHFADQLGLVVAEQFRRTDDGMTIPSRAGAR